MTTYGDWFTGFGGMTIGAIEAGLEVLFGAEIDPAIAAVYRQNMGDHILVCNLLDTPVTTFPRVDVFHASPPCPNFSNAKANGEETENDIALSAKVAEYITYHLPDVFTLENVYQYRNSQSWLTIAQALHNHGYLFNYWHVNMADYGVPQTRQRMIVIARRDGVMPQLPPATHTAEPQPGLFGTMPRWVSWYEATSHVINSMKAWTPTKRVLDRLQIVDNAISLINTQATNFTSGCRINFDIHEPSFAVTVGLRNTGMIVYDGGNYREALPSFQAILQSFPDWYELPESKKTACRGIGNAVPPLFAEKLYRHLVPVRVSQ